MGHINDNAPGLFGHSAVLLNHEIVLNAGRYRFTSTTGALEKNKEGFLYCITVDSTFHPSGTPTVCPWRCPRLIQQNHRSVCHSNYLTIIDSILVISGTVCFMSWYQTLRGAQLPKGLARNGPRWCEGIRAQQRY